MTRPEIEPKSPGPLANTITIMPMSGRGLNYQCWKLLVWYYQNSCKQENSTYCFMLVMVLYLTLVLWLPQAFPASCLSPPSVPTLCLKDSQMRDCLVGWSFRMHQLHLCRRVIPSPHRRVSWYDTKQSDGEIPVMPELLGMQSTPSLTSLPCQLWPGVIAPDRGLFMGQIELNCVLMLNWITWIRTVLIFKLRTYVKVNCIETYRFYRSRTFKCCHYSVKITLNSHL